MILICEWGPHKQILMDMLEYLALRSVFSTNVVCVKTQQKYASIKHDKNQTIVV